MSAFDYIAPPEGSDADFALRLEDDSLLPWFKPGSTVYILRRTDLMDGDIGLFQSRDGMVFRQFCQDSAGNVYLFPVNRQHRHADLTIPASARMPVCYGKAVLSRPIPLPMD